MTRYLWLIVLVLLGFALRLYQIDTSPFRGDEAFTVLNWVSRPLSETLQSEIPLKDPQPPLTFALFRAWALLFGTSEYTMRLMPALLSIIGIPAMYALAYRIGRQRIAILAAGLWTVHPFLIWHAQDAKIYAIWAAMSTLSVWLAIRALERNQRRDWLIYLISATLTAYLYYLELFSLFALNIYALLTYRKDRNRLFHWLGIQCLIGLMLAPWFLQERLLFGSGYGGTTAPFEPDRILTWLLPALNLGLQTVLPQTLATLWPVVLIVLLAGLTAAYRINRRYTLLLALTGFLPLALISLVSLKLNVFTPRYILSAVPAYIIFIAALITYPISLKKRTSTRAISVFLLAGWLILVGHSLYNYYIDPNPAFDKAPDWRGLVNYLEQYTTPNDFVIQTAADEAFTLYFDNLTLSERLPANPDQTDTEITGIIQQAAAAQRSIWLVAQPPPEWPNANTPQHWLDTHMQQVRNTHIGMLSVRQYMPWEINNLSGKRPLDTFTEVADLLEVEISYQPEPQALLVWLYWQPLERTTTDLKAFVHLTAEINPVTGSPLWSQDDHFIQDGRIATSDWQPGKVYRDVYTIPLADIPSGAYELRIGLYDPETGQRIETINATDHYAQQVTVP